jgi:ribonucleoside-diphosphate reductase alpha subunit
MSKCVDGGGKRPGSIAVYMEPWHADIISVLRMKHNIGDDKDLCPELFLGLWVNGLFMERLKQNAKWSLFDPKVCGKLGEVYGKEFNTLYEDYESKNLAVSTINAQELWKEILLTQKQTGLPYMCYKDSVNEHSNQKNLGTITKSNLCCAIVQYSNKDEIACCNLASISLPNFYNKHTKIFDHQRLFKVVQRIVKNLNKVIDINYYALEQARVSNLRHRPVGIGVQGLADLLALAKIIFDSDESVQFQSEIFETIYYSAIFASKELAKIDGVYKSYHENGGCPVSHGILCPDTWNVVPSGKYWDWSILRQEIKQYGIRNSLLIAPMPTATTAQTLGNFEGCDPIYSNLFSRSTVGGTFTNINRHLIDDFIEHNLWDKQGSMRNVIIAFKGSIQYINCLPEEIKKKYNIPYIPIELQQRYKTAFEMDYRKIIDAAAVRSVYIDQSSSFNLHLDLPGSIIDGALTDYHMYTYEKGLKTGMYYCRLKPQVDAVPVTIPVDLQQATVTILNDINIITKKNINNAITIGTKHNTDTGTNYNIQNQKQKQKKLQLKQNDIDISQQVCTMQEGCVSCGS